MASREVISSVALPARQECCFTFLQIHSLPLSQPMKLGMSQFFLLKDSSEIATVRLFCFVYSECQQNSLKLSFLSFALQLQKNITFLNIIHENTSIFQECIFSLCGNRGRQESRYLLHKFVIFLHLQSKIFDRKTICYSQKNVYWKELFWFVLFCWFFCMRK